MTKNRTYDSVFSYVLVMKNKKLKDWLVDTQSVIRLGPHHELIMASIAQAYVQNACRISSDPSFALWGEEHMLGIDFVEL